MKRTSCCVLAAAAALTLASSAGAQTINFQGYTNGCFGVACAPETVSGNVLDIFQGLTYRNSMFNVTTSGGFVAIGATSGNPNLDNLGSFTLTGSAFNYSAANNPFTMRVNFTVPTVANNVYSAVLTGNVSAIDNGGVFLNFNNSTQNIAYTNGAVSGSFTFAVNDLSVTAGNTVAVTGQIFAAQQSVVPEPGTYALLGVGLLSIAFFRRRRRVA